MRRGRYVLQTEEIDMNSPRVPLLVDQIRFAREYTLGLLKDFHDDEWFAMPGGVTHVAWQTGHLAFAQYRLGLDRIRGEQPDDAQLISPHELTIFGRDSRPDPDPTVYPSPGEILATLARVHEAVIAECSRLDDTELDLPILKPHRLFTTKLGALSWCPMHEMTHAGQLGLLRRLLGRKPQW
jgi:hypothetical protein